jgi:hypothetical protein
MMKSDSMTGVHHLMNNKLTDKSNNSVKAEPLDQMASSLYSSHFAKPPVPPTHPALSGMTQHDPTGSMLTGLPHLTPAPFSTGHHPAVATHHHQGFSLVDDMKYHNPHSYHQTDYSSFAAASAATSMTSSGVFAYPGLSGTPEHSTHHVHHHHAKLNLQT